MFLQRNYCGKKSATEQKKGIARRSRCARSIPTRHSFDLLGEAQLKTGIKRLINGLRGSVASVRDFLDINLEPRRHLTCSAMPLMKEKISNRAEEGHRTEVTVGTED